MARGPRKGRKHVVDGPCEGRVCPPTLGSGHRLARFTLTMLPKLPQLARAPCLRYVRLSQGRKRSQRSRRGGAARRSSARCRNGTWPISTGPDVAEAQGRPRQPPSAPPTPCRSAMPASSPRCSTAAKAARALAQAVREFEALDDLLGRLVSYAGLLYAGNTIDPARAKFYRRRAGAHHRDLARICCSSRSSSTASTTPRSRRRWPIRRSATTGRGSRICARRSPISSRIASSSCSTRSR